LNVTLRGNISKFVSGMVTYRYGNTQNDTGGIRAFPADHYDLSTEWARVGSDHFLYFWGWIEAGKLFNLGITSSISSGGRYNFTTGIDDNRDTRATDRPAGVFRNALVRPGTFELDLRLSREFSLRPEDKGPILRLGIDAFNVLNRVNFSRVVGNASSTLFGQPAASLSARHLQISVTMSF
jgi:hypothetical protein